MTTEEIEVRLPKQIVDKLNTISELSAVEPEKVIAVCLALFIIGGLKNDAGTVSKG